MRVLSFLKWLDCLTYLLVSFLLIEFITMKDGNLSILLGDRRRCCKGLYASSALKKERNKAILLMRFSTDTPKLSSKAYMRYNKIASILRVSSSLVRTVCVNALK